LEVKSSHLHQVLEGNGMTAHTYRGWSISYDHPPIPIRLMDWSATHPDYDASCEGPEDGGWVSNGKSVTAGTLDELKAEIDVWINENEPAHTGPSS
jgi:hypothetical protein